MLKELYKNLFRVFYQPLVLKKIHRTTFYTQGAVKLKIPPGVFHPKYFFSTNYLLQYILKMPLKNKSFFELGAGNGLISITAAKQGALVTASDVSKKVIEALAENKKANDVSITIIESDAFEKIPAMQFDIIAINPPYYPKNPRNEFEKAWYCGENFDYFHIVFSSLGRYMHANTITLMVLSEDCKLEEIMHIALANNFILVEQARKKIYWEWNYIFQISPAGEKK